MAWNWQDPGAGAPERIREAADARTDAAIDARESRRLVSSTECLADEVWSGAAKIAFTSRAGAAVPELRLLGEGWREQGRILGGYADELAALRVRQEAIERERLGNDDEILALYVQLAQASSDEALVMKDPVLYAGWERNRDDVRWRLGRAEDRQAELDARWSRLVSDREDLDRATVAALGSSEIVGGLWGFGAAAEAPTGRALLDRLADLSATELQILFERRPELLAEAEASDPAAVADWWGSLDDGQRTTLFAGATVLMGALNGLPILVRVAANRRNAATILDESRQRLVALDERRELRGRVPHGGRNVDRSLLEKQIAYLEQVVAGDIRLYLYQPENDRIIEMLGDPTTATRVMSFMPGTNASLELMYAGLVDPGNPYRSGSQQEFAAWQVANSGGELLGFVFKDGTFPQLEGLAWNGPQLNGSADAIGANYAAFHQGLDATGVGGLPVTSVEHSFGSAPAGEAESAVAFDTRVLLAPIGMKAGWEANPRTDYFVYAAEDDINKLFYGVHIPVPVLDGLGYGVAPDSGGALKIRESGIVGENGIGKLLAGGLVGGIWAGADSVAHHNQIISSTENELVLRNVLAHVMDAK